MAFTIIRTNLTIYLFKKYQIVLLKVGKVIIFFKYIDYINVFLLNFIIKLFKYTNNNNHFIDIINNI